MRNERIRERILIFLPVPVGTQESKEISRKPNSLTVIANTIR
jgi:hypothetical protein